MTSRPMLYRDMRSVRNDMVKKRNTVLSITVHALEGRIGVCVACNNVIKAGLEFLVFCKDEKDHFCIGNNRRIKTSPFFEFPGGIPDKGLMFPFRKMLVDHEDRTGVHPV